MQDFLQKVYSDEIFAPFLQDFLQNITPFLTVRNKTLIIVWGGVGVIHNLYIYGGQTAFMQSDQPCLQPLTAPICPDPLRLRQVNRQLTTGGGNGCKDRPRVTLSNSRRIEKAVCGSVWPLKSVLPHCSLLIPTRA